MSLQNTQNASQEPLVKRFIRHILTRLLELYKKAHYHEYPVFGDEGEVIGYEIMTTSGGDIYSNKTEITDTLEDLLDFRNHRNRLKP
jgi:hypothetical protein